ncbi:LPS-assembly protein LptD [Devosia sp. PTR5]|uniref:LPS-assembly protein LptD n=1 Tax=Devosia oryzisoli TaxID=2774138 RepID=A0A927IUR2_9HYPH|nr:LPS-assembly protein LptD [Devosia oryzisoli]
MRPNDRRIRPYRLALSLLAAGCALLPLAVHAQGLVPPDFFNAPVDPAAPTAVEADELVFDAVNNVINANGDVVVRASGYTLAGNRLVYRRTSGELDFVGDVVITDPSGNVSRSANLKVTGGLKQAFLDSLTITGYDGSRITADSADYDSAVQTILTRASYAPCGECIDAQGRRIGWSVSAAKVTYTKADGSVALEQPSLALLGVPVAWLPYLWIPNLSNEALQRIPRPSLAYSEEIGLKVEVPFSVYSSKFTDIILSPALVSGQGFLMGAEWVQRFDKGAFQVKASGLYQFNPDAFDFADARREWRGAIQTSGQFVPVEDWTVGFAYAAFTDSAYFEDYFINPGRAAINEVYATHLTADTYIDARVQQYNLLGDNTDQSRDQQGIALPNLRAEHTFRFGPDLGQLDVEGKLLGFTRKADRRAVVNGVPYDYAYAGNRLHGMAQARWQNQYIVGGVVATPFAGVRVDGSYYDGNSLLPSAPPEQALVGATPIAAIDVRYPLVASSPGVTHLVEPIGQIVYRGSDQSAPGITNEDAQSVVLDDTNLFSYNRFTGIDRQETGLRANIGARYLADFNDGSHFELVAGQSFQLVGPNSFALGDQVNAGVGSGLETASSYAVLGAYGRLESGFTGSGKLQLDADDFTIARGGLGVGYAADGWAAALNYRYTEAVRAAGQLRDQNEIGADVTVPVAEYWSVSASAYWDINANSYLLAGAGLNYDDGFLQFGANATRTGPTHVSPDETRVLATFKLKAPAGFNAGYSGAVPLGN